MNSIDVKHEPAHACFSTTVDGELCVLQYRLAGSVMTITHTGVPEKVAGRGIAARLMTAALDAARSAGWKVLPACSYAIHFMGKHPEYANLRAG